MAKSVGQISRSAITGRLSGLSLVDHPDPQVPASDWVGLDVLFAGICGTDLGNISFATSPILEPFSSFPAVLGHEVVARVREVGPAVRRVQVGQRVAVDPMLACAVRGYSDACPSCLAGQHSTCERSGEDGPLPVQGHPLSPGMLVGYHRDLPGGWGERMIAHESQLFALDDRLDDRTAALIEPLSIGVHAVLNSELPPAGPVLVIGSGPIAFATIWALRALGYSGTVIAQAKRPKEMELARALGATAVVRPGDEARDAIVATGASAYQPIIGPEVYAGGGFPLIYDCVGNAGSIGQSLAYASPRGTVVLLGCAAQVKKLDLTMLWARELTVKGFVGYGRERWRGEKPHTFEVTNTLLTETGSPIASLVTHVFPLAEYQDALRVAMDRRRSGAFKVLLTPTG